MLGFTDFFWSGFSGPEVSDNTQYSETSEDRKDGKWPQSSEQTDTNSRVTLTKPVSLSPTRQFFLHTKLYWVLKRFSVWMEIADSRLVNLQRQNDYCTFIYNYVYWLRTGTGLIFVQLKLNLPCLQLHSSSWSKQESVYLKCIHLHITIIVNYSEDAPFLYGITSLVAMCIYWKNTFKIQMQLLNYWHKNQYEMWYWTWKTNGKSVKCFMEKQQSVCCWRS